MDIRQPFTPREKEVLSLLTCAKSNKQIAHALGISIRTVEFHLSRIYSRLGVASRTEAVLKLSNPDLRVSTGNEDSPILRESAVAASGELRENGGIPFWRRKYPLKNLLIWSGGLLATMALVVALFFINHPGETPPVEAPVALAPLPSPTATGVMMTPTPVLSPREQILAEMQRLIDEYNRQVELEKQNGSVTVSTDPGTGAEIFLFSGASYEKVAKLFEDLNEQLSPLEDQYVEVYRREVQPTPFPTRESAEENQSYYDLLLSQYQPIYEEDLANGHMMLIYDPDQGSYQGRLVGDAYARIEITGQAFEALCNAPALGDVDQDDDIAQIRQVTGKADLSLNFQGIERLANTPGLEAAVYMNDTGTRRYWVEVGSGHLAQIDPVVREVVAAFEAKSVDELRAIAEQFALANSERLAGLLPALLYEEGGKGSIYSFRWDYSSKDWSGTDWAMMPPFLQVGILANGEIATYINTLDLFR
jgi:DNA-binding CsgD family transcriptional regulator